jgi:hypothetical protein
MELDTIRAKVMMEDRSTVTLDARTGYYDSKQGLLDLRKDISCKPPPAMRQNSRKPLST